MMYRLLFLFLLLLQSNQVIAAERPNIVYIAVDDLTYKFIGAFGAQHIQTPNIDRLANKGVLFENAIVQGTMCSPSRNSTITGLYPHNLGLYHNGNIRQMPEDTWAFPKGLQAAGYYTSWIGKCHILPYTENIDGRSGVKKSQGMRRQMGFDEVWQSAGRHVALKKAKELAGGKKWKEGIDAYADYLHSKGLLQQFVEDAGKPTSLEVDDYLDGFVANQSAEWIRAYDKEEPFFLWVNFSGPHGPYDPPKKYLELYEPEEVPPLIKDEDMTDLPESMKEHSWGKSEEGIRRQRAEYAGMITFIDEQVGRVLSAIEKKDISDETIVAFYSDHGIMEGDHGLHHKETFFKEVLNGCLIVAGPGVRKEKRETRAVELLDLAKTALDYGNAEDECFSKVYGHSLRPLLEGKGKYQKQFAVAERVDSTALVTADYTYVESKEEVVLFDRNQDINETRNFAKENPELCRELKSKLERWKKKHGPRKEPAQTRISDQQD